IRDGHVTGVQTCALPISVYGSLPAGIEDLTGNKQPAAFRFHLKLLGVRLIASDLDGTRIRSVGVIDVLGERMLKNRHTARIEGRSEERRVGKEGSARGAG